MTAPPSRSALSETAVLAYGQRESLLSAVILVGAALTSLVGLVAGGLLTSMGMGEWYSALAKPPWQPPAWVFSTTWTAIFALKAWALWLVARSGPRTAGLKTALVLFGIQFVLNIGWSAVFFLLQSPTGALLEILVLDAFVLATIWAFGRVSRRAALLLTPYVAWLAFATAINAWIVAHIS